jgi:hypothetical protein
MIMDARAEIEGAFKSVWRVSLKKSPQRLKPLRFHVLMDGLKPVPFKSTSFSAVVDGLRKLHT